MRTRTRQDLANAIYERVGLSRAESSEMVELTLKLVADELVRGNSVKLSTFGTLSVIKKRERMGRNPKSGVPAKITARRILTFRPSRQLKKSVAARPVVETH